MRGASVADTTPRKGSIVWVKARVKTYYEGSIPVGAQIVVGPDRTSHSQDAAKVLARIGLHPYMRCIFVGVSYRATGRISNHTNRLSIYCYTRVLMVVPFDGTRYRKPLAVLPDDILYQMELIDG